MTFFDLDVGVVPLLGDGDSRGGAWRGDDGTLIGERLLGVVALGVTVAGEALRVAASKVLEGGVPWRGGGLLLGERWWGGVSWGVCKGGGGGVASRILRGMPYSR